MATIFIAQTTLQEWSDRGKIELDGETLVLVREKRRVDVEPAVRVIELIGGDDDAHGLVGKVKTASQLVEMGAEHYMDSLIVGDVAYRVVEGYVGDLAPAAKPAGGATPSPVEVPAASRVPSAARAPAPVENIPVTAASTASAGGTTEDTLPSVVGVPVSQSGEEERDPIDDAVALSELFLNTVH